MRFPVLFQIYLTFVSRSFDMFHIVSHVFQVFFALVSHWFHMGFTHVSLRNISCVPFRSLTAFVAHLLSLRLKSQVEIAKPPCRTEPREASMFEKPLKHRKGDEPQNNSMRFPVLFQIYLTFVSRSFDMFHIVSHVFQVCFALVSHWFHMGFTHVSLRNISCVPFRSLTAFVTHLLSLRLKSQVEIAKPPCRTEPREASMFEKPLKHRKGDEPQNNSMRFPVLFQIYLTFVSRSFDIFHIVSHVFQVCFALVSHWFHIGYTWGSHMFHWEIYILAVFPFDLWLHS